MNLFQKLGALFTAKTVATPETPQAVAPRQQITMTRVYDVNRQKVWEMWTKPEKLCQWFGALPFTATPETTKIDFRVGGTWQADLVNQKDGMVIPFRGKYLAIEAPHKLVFTIENTQNPGDANVETVTVTFADHAGTTQMTMTQEGHLSPEQYGDPLRNGYTAFFERMSVYMRLHSD